MNFFSKKKYDILFTIIMVILLISVIFSIIDYMYVYSEREAFERLNSETTKKKEIINLQIKSDRETLTAMAFQAGMIHNDAAGYELMCRQFQPFGLCTNIGVLMSDNTLVTKHGAVDTNGKISFDEEKELGAHMCGNKIDVTNDSITSIRSAVPIYDENGNTKAILYGIISSNDFAEYYRNYLPSDNTYIAILDATDGSFIIDTKDILSNKNISNLANVEYKNNYSYKEFARSILSGVQGYTSFAAKDDDEFLYVCYDDLGIEEWRIMLAQLESAVLSSTNRTLTFLTISCASIFIIVFIYILGIAYSNRKKDRLNLTASEIRKSLLEVNQRNESLTDALKILVKYAHARSAFVSDTYKEECHYIVPEKAADRLTPDEIKYFNQKLFYYASRNRTKDGVTLYSCIIKADSKAKHDMPGLYDFMVKHKIESVIYDVIIKNNSNMYAIGVLNPKNTTVAQLIDKIAACFSMAVYNRKHLERTYRMALTDSLTGTKNRTSFSMDKNNGIYSNTDFACIYIDVNELNYFNNKYGHAAGDQMLKFIGETLTSTFADADIYRMGGDEFLVLTNYYTENEINDMLEASKKEIEEMKYHIAYGVNFAPKGMRLEDAVNEAEKAMYQNKADYYQDKQIKKVKNIKEKNTSILESGIKELDAVLSVMTIRYSAVYYVSLDSDSRVKILAHDYFDDINNLSYSFSSTLKKYINEYVKPEYHRAFLNFLEYDSLKKHFKEQQVPTILYERIDGTKIKLKIHCIDINDNDSECIWVFEKEDN